MTRSKRRNKNRRSGATAPDLPAVQRISRGPKSQVTPPADLPPQVLNEMQLLAAQASFSVWSGPLPAPEVLIRYNDAAPDAADRLLKLAEAQAHHRMNLERSVVQSDIKRANRGLSSASS